MRLSSHHMPVIWCTGSAQLWPQCTEVELDTACKKENGCWQHVCTRKSVRSKDMDGNPPLVRSKLTGRMDAEEDTFMIVPGKEAGLEVFICGTRGQLSWPVPQRPQSNDFCPPPYCLWFRVSDHCCFVQLSLISWFHRFLFQPRTEEDRASRTQISIEVTSPLFDTRAGKTLCVMMHTALTWMLKTLL